MRIVRLVAAATAALLVLPHLSGLPAQAQTAPDPIQEGMGCDTLDPALCLFPFPNDAFTQADETTATGRILDFDLFAMPRNGTDLTTGVIGGEGKPVDPAEWNRNDGFSPGQAALTFVPGLDLHQTWGTTDREFSEAGENEHGYFDHRDHIADIALYERPDAPIVILNADTGERHPFWSELDSHRDTNDARRALILRPAVNYDHGARYIVALRNLRDGEGEVIEPRDAFTAFRDGEAEGERAEHMEDVFSTLESAGIERDDLYLAWDFTVISQDNMAERILHLRDDAFGRVLGDEDMSDRVVQGEAPEFTVTSTEELEDTWTDSHGVEHTQRYRRVEGRVTVPNYLDRAQQPGSQDAPPPGSRLNYGSDGLPEQNSSNPTVNVPYVCDVPLDEGPTYGTLYGHGLLGSRNQIGDVKWPRRFGFNGCGADWWGMSTNDLPTVGIIIADLSSFPSLPDRAQQGFLNFMFLGRAMVHPDGFVTHEAFTDDDGGPLMVTDSGEGTELFYDGNSQGGIMGGSLVAVSPDISRGILGVPGMNYSTLLNRSVDWEGAYGEAYYATYQDPLERQLGMQLIQMLWDRGESNGYGHHLADDPLPNTPPHDVMLQVAWSDHQVTNVAAEVMGATSDMPIMVPGLPEGRHWEMDPYYHPTATYPHKGSALVYWDSGNAPPPNGNIPADENGDPHSHPRNEPAAGWQEAHFLLTGWMTDVCNGGDYLTLRHPDNDDTPSCVEPERAPGVLADDEVEPGEPGEPGEVALERVRGDGRIDTAVALSVRSYDTAEQVVLARADDFPDALAGATLAAEVDGPILLTGSDELAPQVAEELERLGTDEVFLAGGTAALSEQIEVELLARGITPTRLSGADRFATAVRIAEEVVSIGGAVDTAIIARADAFPDALAAGTLAIAARAPILLTTREDLHADTATALDELLDAEDVVHVAGGAAVVSEEVAARVREAGYVARRSSGVTRYDTAVALVETAREHGAGLGTVALASGLDFPDALAAGPAVAQLAGSLLLVDPADLGNSPATRDYLRTHAETIERILVAGGTAAVSQGVAEAAAAAASE